MYQYFRPNSCSVVTYSPIALYFDYDSHCCVFLQMTQFFPFTPFSFQLVTFIFTASSSRRGYEVIKLCCLLFWTNQHINLVFAVAVMVSADKAQVPVSYNQSYHTMCQHQHTYATRVLSTGRLWRENFHLYFYHAVSEVSLRAHLRTFNNLII